MKRFTQSVMLMLLMLMGANSAQALESYDFQDLCMALGKGGPWAVNDGGDAGFTVNEATMHYLGDYTDKGFSWNQRFAYEYVADRGKFTMRNKNNKKDGNCGMFSWDYPHYFSILNLKDGDKVTITVRTGTVTIISENAGETSGTELKSGQTYTISTTDATTHFDIQMAKASLIAKIVIEPAGVESIPVIALDRETLILVPTATQKLVATVDPANTEVTWKSDNTDVATVDAEGNVTAVAAGTANISANWASTVSDATASASCAITVSEFSFDEYEIAKTYDFTTMGDITLELQSEAAGAIWNDANTKNNNVFFCTNEGLEKIAVQAAGAADGKGWSIVSGQGLFLGTGAGRCAAVGGIEEGQVVEFLYTGEGFYTRSDDDGIEKVALNEAAGRVIYKASEAGMIGFELVKGNAVKTISIYKKKTATAIQTVKGETAAQQQAVYNLAGQQVKQAVKGLYIVNGRKYVVK